MVVVVRQQLRQVWWLLPAVAVLVGCRQSTPQPEPAGQISTTADAPPDAVADQWVVAADGQLALRLTVEQPLVDRQQPVVLIAELQNRGQESIPVIKPFGDWYLAQAVGVAVTGPGGPLKYTGSTPGYVLGTAAFLWLEPGEAFTDRLILTTEEFAGIDEPGPYRLQFTYQYDGQWDDVTPARSVWRGQIVSKSATVRRQ